MTAQWDCSVWNDQFPAKCDWGVAAIPVENEDTAYQQWADIGFSYVIGSKGIEEGREDAIALVFNYLYSDEMMVRRAESGIYIPVRADIVDQCDFSASPKGWNEYNEMAKISIDVSYLGKKIDLDGLDNYTTEFINNVWPENESVDEWAAKMTERYNSGAELYIENASEDVAGIMNARKDPNLDIRR